MIGGPFDGDAWRYAANLDDPQAARDLLQAALMALGSIRYARRFVNPEEVGTLIDWPAIERALLHALKTAGHPAGDQQGGSTPPA